MRLPSSESEPRQRVPAQSVRIFGLRRTSFGLTLAYVSSPESQEYTHDRCSRSKVGLCLCSLLLDEAHAKELIPPSSLPDNECDSGSTSGPRSAV